MITKNFCGYSHKFIESFRLYLSQSPHTVAKLDAYEFNRNVVKLIYDYQLSNRSQKTKVCFLFSAYLDIFFTVSLLIISPIYGVPQDL